MKNQALELHSPLPKSFKVCKERTMEKRKTEDSSCSLLSHFWSTSRSPFFTCYIPFQSSGSQESNASNRVRFGAEMRKIWPLEANCSSFSKYGCYVMAWMQSHGNFSQPEGKLLDFYPLFISYELLEGEVFNSKFCINPLEPISMAIERASPRFPLPSYTHTHRALCISPKEYEKNVKHIHDLTISNQIHLAHYAPP
ncbi:hypothetical protein AAG906_035890 [Vitis piasezkii]